MVFATMVAIALFTGLVFFFFTIVAISSAASSDKSEVKDNSILVIDLNKAMTEQSQDDRFPMLGSDMEAAYGLNDLLTSIKNAKNDAKIKGIYLKTGVSPNGWASLQELREALVDFSNSGKFILAYGEICDQKSLYISSVSKQHFVNPVGGVEFNGLSISGMFFKGALDKLDIKTEAFHCGQYKGAYEPYKLEKYSEPNRFQLSVLLNDMYGEFLKVISEKTGKDSLYLATMANSGVIKFPKNALEEKMIDGILYVDSVESILKEKSGIAAKDKLNFINPDDYVSAIETKSKSKDKIAILYADGAIYDGEGDEDIHSKNITKSIRKIAEDKDIKAVVLRINSPGGSALASEIIYKELKNLQKQKPITVSMGNYAASGGYYIACASDSIFADANTLTGSIGVVGVLFNIHDMLKNKLGVTSDQVKTGPFADFPNLTRPMTETERNWIQSYLDTTYNTFKSRVASARNMTMEQVEELAQGHVYSGKLAKQIGLVDDLGNKDRAIASAASLAKLKDYKIEEFPKPINKFEQILSNIVGKKREEAAIKRFLGQDYELYQEIKKIRENKNMIIARMPWMDIQ